MRFPLLLLATGLFVASQAPAQGSGWIQIYQSTGQAQGDSFGFAAAAIDDVDGDAIPDFLVGMTGSDLNGLNSGGVSVRSGADGSEILAVGGEAAGDLLGSAVAGLSDYTGDGVPEFAAGAYLYSGGAGGFFAGRVYVFDGSSGAILDRLDGALSGDLFGSALTAFDFEGDGVLELAASAIGVANSTGEVSMYQWSGGAGGAMVLLGTISGSEAGEMFGYSLASGGDLRPNVPGDELVIGSPFSNDGGSESGALTVTSQTAPIVSLNPGPGADDVNMGMSVDGIAPGGGTRYVAAGAPNTANGSVYLWDGSSLSPFLVLDGVAAGDQFGYSIDLMDDKNFDGLPDIAIGAPFANGAGQVQVYDFNAAVPTVLQEMDGLADSRFGWVVAEIGDVNGSSKLDLVIGGPGTDAGQGKSQGAVAVWSPPDSNLPPPDLQLLGPLIEDEDVDLQVDNLKENSDVYFYAGINNNPSVSVEGFQLDIGGPLPLTAWDIQTGVTGGTVTVTFPVPYGQFTNGDLYFQVVEERGGFVRNSNVVSDVVLEQPFTLEISPVPLVNQQPYTLQAKYGWPNAQMYFFVGPALGSDPSGPPWFINNTGLTNPRGIRQYTSDAKGWVTHNDVIPQNFAGFPTAGRQAYFSAVSWFSGIEKLAVVDGGIIQ